jgi:hypothetical protein
MQQVIRRIVDRCNVGMSNREVIRYVISRLRQGYKTWASLPRKDRRKIMQTCIAQHRSNRELYRTVVGGKF